MAINYDWGLLVAYGVIISLILEWLYRIPYKDLKQNKSRLYKKVNNNLIEKSKVLEVVSTQSQTRVIKELLAIVKMRDMHERAIIIFKRECMATSILSLFLALLVITMIPDSFKDEVLAISVISLLFLVLYSSMIYQNDRDINKYLKGEKPEEILKINITVR